MGYKNYSQPQLVEFFLHDDFRLKFLRFYYNI